MTAKEAKAYLSRYRESLDRVKEVNAHLNELKAEAVALKNYLGQKVALDDAVQKYVDACDDAGGYLEMLNGLRQEIRQTIESVPNVRLRALLREIYISGKSIVRIAADRGQSYEHICRLHGAALLAVSKIIRKA